MDAEDKHFCPVDRTTVHAHPGGCLHLLLSLLMQVFPHGWLIVHFLQQACPCWASPTNFEATRSPSFPGLGSLPLAIAFAVRDLHAEQPQGGYG